MDFVVVQTNTSRIYHKYFLMNLTFNKHNTSTFDDFFFFNFIDKDSIEGYKGYKVHTSQNVTDCLLNYKNIT